MFYKWVNHTLILDVLVIPNSKSDEIVGPFESSIKIKITAPAKEGKANDYLVSLLSKQFKVPKSHIKLAKGAQNKYKKFHIQSPKILPKWLNDDPSN